ncbi:NADH-quinone oxidoreductase subunit G [Campylobacter canadensis]|uniref:NADH-quinone oxidoreductase subunit G n=1 Tax=Campylobacter canadensis TaxID=449520 RepID=A0ABS7WPV5_9BACT|nr:NADH-quinone oxidoreductase subunit G [Campylobacter canadensis]MBZ7986792.1 NADH-quinone oxidoreductase subunit G [Campylobacter canadensis]MBZ7997829.1 NADH-quinone oxidoreductase subunit G [Campylobacter canadensis]
MKITINGKVVNANDGDYVLQVARANDIFIPAICYLNDCSPTLACRMCMIEVDSKRSYACNTKVKEGMQILTNTKELWDERNAIMQTYCINHPLQCGVCDKSGECELQNFTHKAKVDTQSFYIKDIDRRHKDWGMLQYDPSLCIVCERCITVCKDKIGDNELKTVARGGEAPAKEFKETMSKDANAVWAKFQKSLIAPQNEESLQCQECAECVSVCPTGALINKNFQYRSNAWELSKIPASNPHSSDCELMYYDVKQKSINDNSKMIYRVSNDFHFASLSKAARFAFDIANECKFKDEKEFSHLVSLFKDGKIKNVKFNSYITNEEAYILELLRQKYSFNLVNNEALCFQNFINNFIYHAKEFYNASSNDIKKSDFIISLGSFLRNDHISLYYNINNAIVMNKGAGLNFYPIKDKKIDKISKNFINVNYNFSDEAKVLEFILQYFAKDLPSELSHLANEYEECTKEVEVKTKDEQGNEVKQIQSEIIKKSSLAKMINFDEDKLKDLLIKKSNFTLIIGADCIYNPNASYIAYLCACVQKYTNFKVFIIPPRTNTLGVSLLCKLSKEEDGFTLGYNERGDFSFSNDEHNNLLSSMLNQQEGTFTNYDKRLVPTNAALKFDGYFLNDLANALGLNAEYTIEYTKKLPLNKGFKNIDFDNLSNYYDNAGNNHRGYLLNTQEYVKNLDFQASIKEYKKFELNNDDVIVLANPIANFSKYTNKSSSFNECACLYASKNYLTKHNLKENSMVKISNENEELIVKVVLDENIENSAYLPTYDDKINPFKFFKTHRYCSLNVKEIV